MTPMSGGHAYCDDHCNKGHVMPLGPGPGAAAAVAEMVAVPVAVAVPVIIAVAVAVAVAIGSACENSSVAVTVWQLLLNVRLLLRATFQLGVTPPEQAILAKAEAKPRGTARAGHTR